ncbi:MAG TPA: exonuclease domain-containing protein [Candidatus Paceibacterota bacterium]|nr:exonuclease domain-containing protein [Candidatus Paceibacterota bacterium]
MTHNSERIECLAGATYAFVDVETTGTSARYGQIIEIGIIRVEDGFITDTYQTLLKPAGPLPPVITSITGIQDKDLEDAPVFESVSGRIQELLEGAIFVAHNAAFDYSFVKQEFSRLGIRWNAKSLCTVKVSRHLFPAFDRHNLDALIARHGLSMENRHRAYDDAYALVEFLTVATLERSLPEVTAAMKRALGMHSLPFALDPALVKDLPHAPGVYIFYGSEDDVLYVGKSVDIKTRVLSHFSEDRRTGRERALCEATSYIEHEETSGELSALLRESQLIKELMPIYNRKLRKAKKLAVIACAEDERGYLTASSSYRDELTEADLGTIEAVFKTATQGKTALRAAAKEYELCLKLLSIEQGAGTCFSYQLGRCRGACAGKEAPQSYNARFAQAFTKRRISAWPFPGAVMLPEDPAAEEGTAFVIDKWRIIKTLSYTADGYDEEDIDTEFDYDSYRILASHLLKSSVRARLMPYRESMPSL